MQIEINMGEAIDRLSILKLKEAFSNVDVQKQIEDLSKMVGCVISDPAGRRLCAVNLALWKLENMIRSKCENWDMIAASIFGLNEIRAELKKEIDIKYHGDSVEGKQYDAE